MRLRNLGVGLTVGAAAIATTLFLGSNAYASHGGGGGGRPCGEPVTGSGHGTLGSPWTDKSMYDDDGPVQGAVVVGEEFEINTGGVAGQQWHVVLADNGHVFFDQIVTSTTAGIKAMSQSPLQGTGNQNMTAVGTRDRKSVV